MTQEITRTRPFSGPSVLTPREVRALIQAPDRRSLKGKRDAALLAVLVGGGLRVGEAVSLTVFDIEVAKQHCVRLTFQTSKSRRKRLRTVTLPEWAAASVSAWLGLTNSEWLFPGNKGEHLSVRAAEKIVVSYLKAVNRSDLHTHSLRHTFGSMVTRETRSLFVAQKLLGHADPRTTSHYYSAFEVSDADNAADALSAALAPRGRRTPIGEFRGERFGRRGRGRMR
jgi:integrase